MKRLMSIAALTLGLLLVAAACGGTDATPDRTTAGDADEPAVVLAMGPGISVTEALQSALPGPLLVNGFIVTTSDNTVYLAELLAESLPPQRGGATLIVEGLDLDQLAGLSTAQGITWSDQPVQILGDVANGVLTVTTTASG